MGLPYEFIQVFRAHSIGKRLRALGRLLCVIFKQVQWSSFNKIALRFYATRLRRLKKQIFILSSFKYPESSI
jgi:hypothetical protein